MMINEEVDSDSIDFTRPLIEFGIEVNWRGEAVRTTTYHIEQMKQSGIDNTYLFIEGYKDALGENGFNSTDKDYICGFKFGVTGIVDIKK